MLKVVKQENLEVKMFVDTEFEEHRFETFFDKEPETIDWIKTFQRGGIFFDIGANVGVYSLFAGAFFKDELKIFSFEPVYHNFNKLCQNIIANNLKDITPVCLAVADKTKLDQILLASDVSGSANHLMADAPSEMVSALNYVFKQGAFAASLDDLVANFGMPLPNYVKIDTDGFEENIVIGAKTVFSNKNLKSVLIEITDNDNSRSRIIAMMKSYGLDMNSPINFQGNHSRKRREKNGKSNIENIIFSR